MIVQIRDDQQNTTGARPGEEKREEQVHGFVFSKLQGLSQFFSKIFHEIFLPELYPTKQSELTDFRSYLIDSSNPMTPLKAWQMQDLSFQCAVRALNEKTPEEAFNILVELSQNFPSRAR